jgi:hypothetical protein
MKLPTKENSLPGTRDAAILTGTGRELIARAIHGGNHRKENCKLNVIG